MGAGGGSVITCLELVVNGARDICVFVERLKLKIYG